MINTCLQYVPTLSLTELVAFVLLLTAAYEVAEWKDRERVQLRSDIIYPIGAKRSPLFDMIVCDGHSLETESLIRELVIAIAFEGISYRWRRYTCPYGELCTSAVLLSTASQP
jgi:hypothetical protein